MKLRAEAIQKRLEGEGLAFSKMSLQHIGRFASADADWNYKDIPHLNEVHKQVDGVPAIVEDDLISNFFLQKIGPVRIPLTVTNYSVSRDCQVYFSSALFFVLVIETSWSEDDEGNTTVITTYRVGSGRILKPLHRVIFKLLKRNYDVLMSADIPMRLQRGRLRDLGIRFQSDSSGYSFLKTLNLGQDNVIAGERPTSIANDKINIENIPSYPQIIVVGDNDVWGVALTRKESAILAFPRICPHEGADLTKCSPATDLTGDIHFRCPWHGRKVSSSELFTESEVQVGFCSVSIDKGSVNIRPA